LNECLPNGIPKYRYQSCKRPVHFRSSLGCVPAQGITLNFDSNAHHHGSLPQQLGGI
jgi:hypothetical protein